MIVVVDTNVPKVANGKRESPQASKTCRAICIDRVERIMRGEETVVLDRDWAILSEYMDNLNESGQPGTGDEFLLWVLRNRESRCEWVSITRTAGLENEYDEFPVDPDLDKFDADDRKFVAAARAHSDYTAPILQAVDGGWRAFCERARQTRGEGGVSVRGR